MMNMAFAGTGTADDAYLFILAIIAALGLVLSVLYSITFIKKGIQDRHERTMAHTADEWKGEAED